MKELVVLHDREPSLREVYVEGVSDKFLLRKFLAASDLQDVSVFSIDVLAIQFDEFSDLGWENNNRSRVLYAAKSLEDECNTILESKVVCVIDSDFDFLLGVSYPFSLLLSTEFTSIEMYAFSEAVLTKFFNVVLKIDNIDLPAILKRLESPLVKLFLIRAANQVLSLGIDLIRIEKAWGLSGIDILFDEEEYLVRCLHKGNKAKELKAVVGKIAKLQGMLPKDLRCAIRGHDFFEALEWYVHRCHCKVKGGDFFGSSIVGCLESSDLAKTKLFSSLRDRLTRKSNRREGLRH